MSDAEKNPGSPYTVSYGWYRENWEKFDDFDAALKFYIRQGAHDGDAILVGDGYDCDCDQDGYFMCSDGLTEAERDRIEYADAVAYRWKRLRQRAFDQLVAIGVQLFQAPPWSTAELEATAALDLARKRDERLVERALVQAESRLRDEVGK